MKNLYKTALAVIAATTLLTSCSGDDESTPVNNEPLPTGSYIKGKVDGVQFQNMEIMGISTAVATRTGTGDGTLITVSGTNMDSNTMLVNMYGITTTGTYTVDADDDGIVLAYVMSGEEISYDTSNCDGATGTLNVTYLDNTKVEGTFHYTGKEDENCANSKAITEGSFRGIFMN